MHSETGAPTLRRRSSAFTEIGLEGHDPILDEKIRTDRPKFAVRFRSNVSVVEPNAIDSEPPTPAPTSPVVAQKSLLSHIPVSQLALLVAIVALALPVVNAPPAQSQQMSPLAQAVPVSPRVEMPETLPAKRQTTTTDVCKRWSGQSAVVNGTVYYYGGRATTSADQTTDQWSKCRAEIRRTSTDCHRQRLPFARPDNLVADRIAIFDRIANAIRSACRVSRSTLGINRQPLPLWWPVLRLASDVPCALFFMVLRYRRQQLERAPGPYL